MEYGKEMMSEDGWRYLCSEFDDNVSTSIFSKVNKSLTEEAGSATGLVSASTDNQDLLHSLLLNGAEKQNQEL